MITLYQYPRCSTCVKARKWLETHELEFKSINIVEAPPSVDELKRFHQTSGLPIKRLFNTSGQSYRQGGFKEILPTLSDTEAYQALADDGKLIKRPLLVFDQDGKDYVYVGFKESSWAENLS